MNKTEEIKKVTGKINKEIFSLNAPKKLDLETSANCSTKLKKTWSLFKSLKEIPRGTEDWIKGKVEKNSKQEKLKISDDLILNKDTKDFRSKIMIQRRKGI